jgi:hypothetical protein
MKLVEPKKPRKPSEPYSPSIPTDYAVVPNRIELDSNANYTFKEICNKLNVKFDEIDPEKLIVGFDYYRDYDYSSVTVSIEYGEIKAKKSQYIIDYETKDYYKKLKKYQKDFNLYNERLKKYNEEMKVYNVQKAEYDKQMKEVENQKKLETFNRLKKELGL